jgi:hypothetical protein
MEMPGRAQGRWRLRHSWKAKEAKLWSHWVRNQGIAKGKKRLVPGHGMRREEALF